LFGVLGNIDVIKGDEILDGIIEVYTCPKCKNDFPDISNSAPPKNGELCVSCFIEEALDKLDQK